MHINLPVLSESENQCRATIMFISVLNEWSNFALILFFELFATSQIATSPDLVPVKKRLEKLYTRWDQHIAAN